MPTVSPLRVLVVEDDADARLLHRQVLSSIGDVREAADAYQALALMEEGSFDVIVTDLYMPGVSGADFVELLRARGDQTPVVIVTAAGERALENRDTADLVFAVLAKPVPIAALVRAVCMATSHAVTGHDELEREPLVVALRRQSAIAANLSEGVALMSAVDGTILYTNPAFDRLFGYPRGNLHGKPASILNGPNAESTPEEMAASIVESLRATGVWRGQIETVRADGEHFWCEADVSSYDDIEYGPVWISVYRDVTAQRRAEEALQASERRFRLIVDRTPLGLALVDHHLRLTSVNAAFAQTVGYAQDALVGLPLENLTREDEAIRTTALAADLLGNRRGEFSVETRYLTAAGKPIWVEVNGVVIPAVGEAGSDQVLLVVEDVSARRATEQNLSFLATHDMLTGVENRSTIEPAIERALARAERTGSWVGVAFLDLDRFKQVNDMRGHAAGDEFLREVTRELVKSLRPGDSFARVGGDEFAACCEELGTDDDEAIAAAEDLGRRLVAAVDSVARRADIGVGCSVGITLARRRELAPGDLLHSADAAMYRVKGRGGGSVEVELLGEQRYGSAPTRKG